jgi:hypothetical protein
MSLHWLNKGIRWAFGTLVAFLIGWLGIERKKHEKLSEKIEQQKIEIDDYKKIIEVQKATQAVYVEAVIEKEKIEHEQTSVEKQIDNAAQSIEETIAIANDIISRFNTK